MILFYYGNDRIKSRDKAKEAIAQMHKKRPEAELFTLTTLNWYEGVLDEFVLSQGLFEKKYIVLCDNLAEKKENKEEILARLEALKKSDNAFVIIENTLDPKTHALIASYAEKAYEFVTATSSKVEFNMFSLAEALGKRDKKNLWVLYQRACAEHISPEEIHGILLWQLKTMIISSQSTTAEEADLKPFVYSKAKGYLKNFTQKELTTLYSNLVSLYHDARRGKGELETNVERWVLTM